MVVGDQLNLVRMHGVMSVITVVACVYSDRVRSFWLTRGIIGVPGKYARKEEED